MIEVIIIIFLLVFIVFVEVRNYLERKALLDRIMAKNYHEYSSQELNKQVIAKTPKTVKEEGIPL